MRISTVLTKTPVLDTGLVYSSVVVVNVRKSAQVLFRWILTYCFTWIATIGNRSVVVANVVAIIPLEVCQHLLSTCLNPEQISAQIISSETLS